MRRLRLCGCGLLLALLAGAAGLGLSRALPAAADTVGTTTTSSCPSANPPNELTLVAGSPQTARLDAPFGAAFQVTLANTDGCPVTTTVAGTAISFSAPATGPSGVFSASGSTTLAVGADASGSASAQGFAANDLAGSYTLTASSAYGSVAFSLTNSAAGAAASLIAEKPLREAAYIDSGYNQPLQVEVLDANGNPVEGTNVTFTLGTGAGAQGSAAAAGASFAGGGAAATVTTNSLGLATSPPLTANGEPGLFTATASTPGVSDPASFDLDNVATGAPTLTLSGAARRSAVAGNRYRLPLQVTVRGPSGAPAEGVTVTFTLGVAGGAGTAAAGATFADGSTQATEVTGARGRATSPFFVANDTAGTFTASISVSGRTNPLSVSLDNLAAAAPTIAALGPTAMSAKVDARYRRSLGVRVLSHDGRPLLGVTVTFTLGAAAGGNGATGAGASFANGASEATETTDSDGVARSPYFTANATPGTFSAAAAVASVTNPATFTLDNLAVPPPTLRRVGRADTRATVGESYRTPLRVRLLDADAKPLAGVTVTFVLGVGSGAGAAAVAGASFVGGGVQATATTDSAGVAVSPGFSANTVAGAFVAAASSTVTPRIVRFPLQNLAGKPAKITAGVAASESTPTRTHFPIRLAVTVTDADGNPVPGLLVSFAAPAHGPSGRFSGRRRSLEVRTNADGIAVAPEFTANGTVGGYIVKAVAAPAAPAAFALVNEPRGQPT